MGVSFKVARTGSRYRPKLCESAAATSTLSDEWGANREDTGGGLASKKNDSEADSVGVVDGFADYSVSSACTAHYGSYSVGLEHEASFSLNLFPDGFSIGKPSEGMLLPLVQDVPKRLHPYDKASMALFSAIEYGWLPGDILDDIPCKYHNGTIVCEVWDYRNCMSKLCDIDSPTDELPKFHKVLLKMCMENVVKDMPSISDDSWTYNDLLQAESQIVKKLQPVLCLDPIPLLDRLCRTPESKKLDLGICHVRPKVKQQDAAAIKLISHEGDISSNIILENFKSQTLVFGDGAISCTQHAVSESTPNMQQNCIGKDVRHALQVTSELNCNPKVACLTPVSKTVTVASSVLVPEKDLKDSFVGMGTSATTIRKRCSHEPQQTPKPMLKRPKLEHQSIISQRHTLTEHDLQWKSTLLVQQLEVDKMRNARYSEATHPQLVTSEPIPEVIPKKESTMPFYLDKKSVQCKVKEEPIETDTMLKPGVENDWENRKSNIVSEKSNQQQFLPSGRSHFPSHMQGSNPGPSIAKSSKKEVSSSKKKPSQGPRVSTRRPAHSSTSSKLGELSSISCRVPRRLCPAVAAVGLQLEKTASVPPASIGVASVGSDANDSLLQENQMSLPAKMKSESLLNVSTPSLKGIELSNALVSTISSSIRNPSVLPPSVTKGDLAVLERFTRIAMLTQRYGLNKKTQKRDKFFKRTSFSHSPQLLSGYIKSDDTEENRHFMNGMCMSKYPLDWGSNVVKARILTFVHSNFFYGGTGMPNMVCKPPKKLVLYEFEENGDHQVGARIKYEDEDQPIDFAVLPNIHYADMFAAQFTSLMECEGYILLEDQLLPSTVSTISAMNTPVADYSQVSQLSFTMPIPGQMMNAVAPIGSCISTTNIQRNPCQHIQSPGRLLPSFYNLSRPQQLDIVTCLSNMQQQQHQTPGSFLHSGNNSLVSRCLQMENQIFKRLTYTQFLQLHQKHSIMQRNVSNIMGMVGGCASSLDNIGQINTGINQLSGFSSLNQQFLNGGISESQMAVLSNLRQTNRNSRNLNSGITGNGSLIGQALSKTGMDQLHCMGKFPMALPQHSSTSLGMNNHGLLQNQKQQYIQQQGRRRRNSHHQHAGSPTMAIQMSRATHSSPQQSSSGVAQQQVGMNLCTVGSPQLSTQTVGSGGSVTNSAMEVQGLSKGEGSG